MKTTQELLNEFVRNWAPYNMAGPSNNMDFDCDFDELLKAYGKAKAKDAWDGSTGHRSDESEDFEIYWESTTKKQ